MFVSGAAAIYGTVTTLVYIDRKISLITSTEASFVGYPQTEVGVPFPTLYGEMNIKH
jgi:hypothetical protein